MNAKVCLAAISLIKLTKVFGEVSAAIDIDKLPTWVCTNAHNSVSRCLALWGSFAIEFHVHWVWRWLRLTVSYQHTSLSTRKYSQNATGLRITRETIIVLKSSSSFRQPFWRIILAVKPKKFHLLTQGVPKYSANNLIQLKLRLLSRVIACRQKSREFSNSCQFEMFRDIICSVERKCREKTIFGDIRAN